MACVRSSRALLYFFAGYRLRRDFHTRWHTLDQVRWPQRTPEWRHPSGQWRRNSCLAGNAVWLLCFVEQVPACAAPPSLTPAPVMALARLDWAAQAPMAGAYWAEVILSRATRLWPVRQQPLQLPAHLLALTASLVFHDEDLRPAFRAALLYPIYHSNGLLTIGFATVPAVGTPSCAWHSSPNRLR